MLEVRELTVRFAQRMLFAQASLTVAHGEIVALLGPSGTGKSTLLKVIAGLLHPDEGCILLDNVDITTVPTHQRDIGMVFQNEQLFPHRTVAQNIEFGLRMRGWDSQRRTARVSELLDLIGMPGFQRRRVTDLSGGEAKRVALARTLAPSPRVVLLDEPLTGLDCELHDQLARDLHQLLRATATTALVVTHDRDEAAVLASRVVAFADLTSRLPVTEAGDLR
ncbi:MAG: ABC transporter ATP-binding protein [Actinomycetota bacterium]|jgi:thiamine transport system ATP-binding protein